MATYCPNKACNYQLKLSDWRQNCPQCDANILYYHMEERLDDEADHVELASAATRKWMNRAGAALIRSGPVRVRLAFLIAPLFLGLLFPALVFLLRFEFNLDLLLEAATPFAETGGTALMFDLGLVLAVLAWVAGLATMSAGAGPRWFGRNMLISCAGLGGAVMMIASTAIAGAAVLDFQWLAAYGFLLAFVLLLCINLVIRLRGGIAVNYTQNWIAFCPEDEVYGFIKETGGTVKDFRRMKAEEAGREFPPKQPAGPEELACVNCGGAVIATKQNFDRCEYCRNHAVALGKLERQKRLIALIEAKKRGTSAA